MSSPLGTAPSGAVKLRPLAENTIPISSAPAPARTLPSELGVGELMAWLTEELQRSDGSIRDAMVKIGSVKTQNEQLAQIKTDLDRARNNSGDDKDVGGYGDPSWVHAQDFYKRMDASQQAQVDAFLAQVHDDGKGGHIVSGDAIKSFTDVLGDQINANTSNNEMSMIRLQSDLSARGQKIQIASSIIASMHEVEKSIIGKIG
jgi:hypothetical protein